MLAFNPLLNNKKFKERGISCQKDARFAEKDPSTETMWAMLIIKLEDAGIPI